MGTPLILVLLAFVVIMAGVLALCLVMRRRSLGNSARPAALEAGEIDDNRIAFVLFGAIVAGACLALVTAWLLFFSAK
ncbi:MAG TPA: hypothetical protein VFV17_00160 [Usitatibacteraceae bacterium]|nr:hypothetical protein [Usitatibacteraceae bacterium]